MSGPRPVCYNRISLDEHQEEANESAQKAANVRRVQVREEAVIQRGSCTEFDWNYMTEGWLMIRLGKTQHTHLRFGLGF